METKIDSSFLQRAKKIFVRNLKCLNFCKKRRRRNSEENLYYENLAAKERAVGKGSISNALSIKNNQQIDLNNEEEIENWLKFLIEYEPNVENFGLLKRVHCLESLYNDENATKFNSFSSTSTDTQKTLRELNSLHSTYSSLFRPFLPISPLELAKFLAERKKKLNSVAGSSSTSSTALTSASMVGSDNRRIFNMKRLRHRNRERDLALTLNGRKNRLKIAPSSSTSTNSMISDYRLHHWKIRNKIVGFLRRTSHLSLTSDFSSDASYYLIGKKFSIILIFEIQFWLSYLTSLFFKNNSKKNFYNFY